MDNYDNFYVVICPFCGRTMKLYQGIKWDRYYYARYMCSGCGAEAPMVKESNQEKSAKSAYEVATRRANNG